MTCNSFISSNPAPARAAFTLLELVIALAISSLLVVSLMSVVAVSTQTLFAHQGAAARNAETFELAAAVSADLKLALSFSEQNSDAVTFTVPDRDGDRISETIRYRWSNDDSAELFKTIDFSTDTDPPAEQLIATDITTFELNYLNTITGIDNPEPQEEDILSLVYFNDDVPQPTTADSDVLFITAGGSASSSEQDRIDLIESFGFTVTNIAANENAILYTIRINGTDSIYLPSTVSAAVLGDRLDAAEKGIVSENVAVAERLGIGVPEASPLDRKISFVTSRPHFITSDFSAGALPLFNDLDATISLDQRDAFRAPGLETLIGWPNGIALSILDTSDEMYSTSTTTGVAGYTTRYNQQPDSASLNQRQIATQIELDTAGEINSIAASLRVFAPTTVRFGIYADYQGSPGELLGQTEETAVASNTTATFITIPLAASTKVAAGDYWLSVGFKDNASFRYQTGLFATGTTEWADPGFDPTAAGLMSYWENTYTETRRASVFCNYTVLPESPGRRVQLPWTDAALLVENLNDSATTLIGNSLRWAGDTTPNERTIDVEVSADQTVIEPFGPDNLPDNISRWSAGPTSLRIRRNPNNTSGSVQFSLFLADEDDQPTGDPLTQSSLIPTSQFLKTDGYFFYEIPWERTDFIDQDARVCLVVTGTSSDEADIFFGFDFDPVDGLLDLLVDTVSNLIGQGQTRTGNANMYVYGTFQTDE